MKLISFIAFVIYAHAATGATLKAPVYSLRKDENGLRSRSSQIMNEVNAKSPYHSPRMQQLLRPDTGRTPQASWGNVPQGGKDGTGLSYIWVCMLNRKIFKLLTQTKGLRRIRTNHHSRSRHTPPVLSHAPQHLRRRALPPVPALQRLMLAVPAIHVLTIIHLHR